MPKKTEPTVRVNTRIRLYQSTFIKKQSKKENKTEGELYREMIDFYIKNIKTN